MVDDTYSQSAALAGEHAPQLLVMTDPDYRILWVNKAAEGAFAPLSSLVGRFCYEAIEGRNCVCPNCVVAKSHASGKPEEDEIREIAENGRQMYFLVHAQPIPDAEGKPVAWVESTIGLTSIRQLSLESKRLQILLSMQESEGRFASLAQVAPIGIAINVSSRWVWLNELFASILGYEPDELIGEDPGSVALPEDRDEVQRIMAEIIATKSCTDVRDLEVVRKDGVQRTVSTVSTYCVYRGEDAVMSVARDVTEERRAAAALEARHRDLRAIQRMGDALGRSLELTRVIEESLLQAALITGADAAAIGLLSSDGEAARVFPNGGFPQPLQDALLSALEGQTCASSSRPCREIRAVTARADGDLVAHRLHSAGMGALLCIPLELQDNSVGCLWLVGRNPEAFGAASEELLPAVGHEISMALANARLFEQVRSRNRQLAALNSIATALNQSLDITDVLNVALDEMMAITGATAGAISLLDEQAGVVRLAAYRNIPDALYELLREVRIENGWESRVIDGSRALVISDLRSDSNAFGVTLELGLLSAVCVPLRTHEQTVAVLNLLSDEADHFASVSEEFLLAVGSQIGLAVANARLYTERADSEELYRDLFETVPDPVVLISLDGARVMSCNRPFREQFGYSLEDVMGLSVEELIVLEDRPKTQAYIEALLANEALTSTQFEIRGLHRNGEVRDVLVHAVPYHAQNRLIGFQAIARDITDQKRLQASLLRTEKLSALGQLVSGVAHELNNPLATILLAAEMLLQDEPDPAKRSRLEAIIDQVSRSSALTEDLRLFARREEPHRATVDLRLLLERVRDLVAPAFRRENITLIMQLPEHTPAISGNAHQLEQVILNLMTNALQAMEGLAGDHSLTVSVETGHSPRGQSGPNAPPVVRIIFADTGPGVSPDAKTRIFDPFYTSKPPGKGTGLGLSVSLGIAESHNGTIYLESATRGATFVVELPQTKDLPSLSEETCVALQEGTTEPADMGGLRVMVIDDEPSIVDLLTQMLRASNCRVEGAGSASEALQKLTSREYDVVLCDVKMPLVQGSPGYAAIARTYPKLAARLLLMSGDTASVETVQLLNSTRIPALQKPFTYAQLISVLRAVHEGAGGSPHEMTQ